MILAGKAWNIGSCVTGIGGDNLAGWSHLSIFHTGDAFILSEVKGHLSRFAPDISSAGLQCCDSGVFAGVHFHAMPGFGGAIGGRFQFFFWVPGPSCYFGILWGSMMLSPTIPYHILSGDEQTRRGGRDFPWSQWGSSLPSPMAVSGLQWPHGRGVTWCPCWLHPKLFTLPSILGSMVKWCKMWSSQV